ncbi:MAG: radical SAM protein [Candidatus Woesearchaeota archaeon]|nr:radical SAM protein [Candidatus Woesearchaeota archaeon]
MDLLTQASKTYSENFPQVAWFERAIFISWFCAKPTCKFCFMYTIKDQIKQPKFARRRLESILAEALICRICNWEIGFVSAGIASWNTQDLKEVLEGIYKITGKKQWLNLGTLREKQIEELLPFIEGVTGTVETVNWKIRPDIVPDKPIEEISKMFEIADRHNIKKSITIIIGLGETIDDFPELVKLIDKWKIDRINFYRLVPHEGAMKLPGPTTEYYIEWIAKTRIEFPKLVIIAGSWPDRTEEIPLLLKAGANAVTKLPAIKNFGKQPAINIADGVKEAGREFLSELVHYPKVDIDEELKKIDMDEAFKSKVKDKYLKYYKKLGKHE